MNPPLSPEHAALLQRCFDAIDDTWDRDHEETAALLDDIFAALYPTPESKDA